MVRTVRDAPIETDPHGKDQHEPGAKLDAGKPQIGRFVMAYFPRALIEVSKVSKVGAKKYTEMGWASVENGEERYQEAEIRHILKRVGWKEECDEDTQLFHDAQEAWNALAKLELRLREKEEKGEWSPW